MAVKKPAPKASPLKRAKTGWQNLRQRYRDTPHRSFKATPKLRRRYSLEGIRQGWQLILDTLGFIKTHRKPLVRFMVLYGVVAYFLVGGVSQFDYVTFREEATQTVGSGLDAVTLALTIFGGTLMGSFGQTSGELQQFLSGFVAIIFWLAVIWLVRMLSAGEPAKLRDALYNGPAPLVSTLGVMLVMVLQLVPAALGFFALSVAVSEQWLTSAGEGLAFGGAAILLSLLSLYWLSGSVIATMVVALPGMYPLKALAAARTLVNGRRWVVVMRFVSMLIIQLLIWAVVLLPIILLEAWLRVEWLPLVPVAVQLLGGFSLVFSSTYLYKTYRAML